MLVVWTAAACVLFSFTSLVGYLLWNGFGRISWEFFTAPPSDAGRGGGIAPILVSTLLILGVAMAVSLPLAMGGAAWLAEFSSPASYLTRSMGRSVDILAGVPSIVIGLFGNAFFSVTLGLGFSILSGGLTLACMALPIMIRGMEQGLRAVPDMYRQNASALGLSHTTTLWRILLPAALPSITASVVLGMGRAIAETAALIFTSGYVDRMPESFLDSGRSLSVHIFDLSMNVPGGDAQASGSALALLSILLIINLTVQWIMRRFFAGGRREWNQ